MEDLAGIKRQEWRVVCLLREKKRLKSGITKFRQEGSKEKRGGRNIYEKEKKLFDSFDPRDALLMVGS